MNSIKKRSLALLLFALLFGASSSYAQQLITTVAGSDWVFPAGTLSPANTAAPLGPVQGVAVATVTAGLFQAGDIVISDIRNRRVMKITPAGSLTVVAGNGFAGFFGDGGQATSASLALPYGLAIDSSGNLYIADAVHNRIRKVATNGVITTVAGNGTAGSAGDGAVGGATTTAQLNFPTGVAVNAAGDIYIADQGNNRIRKVSGGTINAAAGTGTVGSANGIAGQATSVAQFNQPAGVAVDGSGNVYIADTVNHLVRKLTVSTATVTTVAGNGTPGFLGDTGAATSASLASPGGVAIDASNNLYIADTDNQVIRKVASGVDVILQGTDIINTVAGSTSYGFDGDGLSALLASLASPNGVALNAAGSTIYIADTDNGRLRTVIGGTINTLAGNGKFKFAGDGGPALSASLNIPNSAAVDSSGNLYIADPRNHRIRKVTPTGTISTFAGTGAFGSFGDGGQAASALLNSPTAVAVDTGRTPNLLYIADSRNHRIRVVDLLTNIITTVAGTGFAGFDTDDLDATFVQLNRPSGVAVDRNTHDFYIADTNNHRVRKVSISNNQITTVAGSVLGPGFADGAANVSQLKSPVAVAVDAGAINVYIADRDNHRVRKVNGGTVSTVAGDGFTDANGNGRFLGEGVAAVTSASLNFPSGVAVDPLNTVLYIGDRDNFRIRKVSGGNITTVAGTGAEGFSGDGGLSTVATLAGPTGLWLDAFGNLYVADSTNDRIRKLFSGLISPGSVQGAPGTVVRIPVSLSLFGGATLNSVSFSLKVDLGTGPPPALGTALSFEKDSAFTTTPTVLTSGFDSISVSWLNQGATPPFPIGGRTLGNVLVTLPTAGQGATDGQTYTVKITVAGGDLSGANVPISPGANSTLRITISSYLVGDVALQTIDLNNDGDKNDIGEFGNGVPDIQDVIDTLRARLFDQFHPPCSHRHDAMDSADALGNAGSDNAITDFDVILTLRRFAFPLAFPGVARAAPNPAICGTDMPSGTGTPHP